MSEDVVKQLVSALTGIPVEEIWRAVIKIDQFGKTHITVQMKPKAEDIKIEITKALTDETT